MEQRNLNLIAIDPGGTTGIAVKMAAAENYVTSVDTEPHKVWELITACLWDTVIIERFATAGRISKYGLTTVEIVGGVKAICHALKIPIAVRMPTQRYAWQRTAAEYLRESHMPHVIHQTEALAHMFAWQDKNDPSFTLKGKAVID